MREGLAAALLVHRGLRVVASLGLALSVAGCQTAAGLGNSGALEPSTPTESAWAIDTVGKKCLASVVGGAIVGGILGALSGGGQRVLQGAALGGVAGAGLCVVILALDEVDRARIREAQLAAAQTGQPQNLTYVGADGRGRVVSARPKKVVISKNPSGPRLLVGPATEKDTPPVLLASNRELCTEVQTNAAVETKGATDIPVQYLCPDTGGKMAPVVVAAASPTSAG